MPLTWEELESIRSAYFSDDLPIQPRMTDWTEAQATEFFTSGGVEPTSVSAPPPAMPPPPPPPPRPTNSEATVGANTNHGLSNLDGTVAQAGALGRWLCDPADFLAAGAVDVSTITARGLAFPRNWPAVFQQNGVLKGLLNQRCKGKRVRAVSSTPSGPDGEAALGAPVRLMNGLHSCLNSEQLEVALRGWRVVKGFMVLECTDAPAGTAFVALRHWWNVSPSGA